MQATLPSQSVALLESVLTNRIEQALAATPATDEYRVAELVRIRAMEPLSARLAAFCDFMIAYTSSMSLQLDEKRSTYINPSSQARIERDYASACELAGVSEGHLAEAVAEIQQENLSLQRLHNQDRAILLKQSDLIQSLRVRGSPRVVQEEKGKGKLKQEFAEIADELAKLEKEVQVKLRRMRGT